MNEKRRRTRRACSASFALAYRLAVAPHERSEKRIEENDSDERNLVESIHELTIAAYDGTVNRFYRGTATSVTDDGRSLDAISSLSVTSHA